MSTTKRPKGAPGDVNIHPGKKLKFDGLEYRGEVRDYKDKDPEEKQPQMAYQAHVEVLNLTDEKDVKKYEKIVQTLVSDQAVMSYEEKKYDESIKGWRLLIVYSDIFYTHPEE